MMALSFNKFIFKLGENLENLGKQNDKQPFDNEVSSINTNDTPGAQENVTPIEEKMTERPGSPFILLLSGGDEEINYTPHTRLNNKEESPEDVHDILDEDSVIGSSTNISIESDPMGFESSGIVSDSKLETERDIDFSNYYRDDGLNSLNLNLGEDILSSSSSSTSSGEDGEHAFLEDDERRSFRNQPMTKENFDKLFDPSGRLVHEHELRKAIFKGGVDSSIRKDVWKFLFELYPFTTTAREREILMVEQTLRYEALKIRWKKLLRTLENDYEGVRYCPKWYTGCPKNANEHYEPVSLHKARVSFSQVEHPIIQVDNVRAKPVNYTLMLPVQNDNILYEHDNKDIELHNIGLVCIENNEEVYESITPQYDTLATSYEDKLSQIHLLTRTSNGVSSRCFQQRDDSPLGNVKDKNTSKKDFKKYRTRSVNFECSGEVEDLSQVLADAMLDVPHYEHDDDNDDDSHGKQQEDYDMLISDNIPSSEQLENYQTSKEEEKEVIFPNPFTLPQEFVNTQESLYSKSENFKSLDIFDVEPIKSNDKNTDDITHLNNTTDEVSLYNNHTPVEEIKSVDSIDGFKQKEMSYPIVHGKGENNKILSVETNEDVFDKNNMNFNNNDKNNCSELSKQLSFDDGFATQDKIINENESMVENRTSFENETTVDVKSKSVIENEMEVENETTIEINTDKVENKVVLTANQNLDVHERRESLARSPTGEKLENIPPWIAQMIKASTPGSPGSPNHEKERRQSDRDIFSLELLNIVENANRYVKEQVKQNSACTTPNNTPVRSAPNNYTSNNYTPRETKLKEIDQTDNQNISSPLLRPRSANELFMNVTPMFQSDESIDTVDNKTTKTECPYCNFDETISPNIKLPVSFIGKEQLKFMEIQAQVYAARQPYNNKDVSASIRVIDKDVPRTDRELDLFSGDDNPGLVKLRDTLLTYAFFHPDVGYAQGMNDIMSRFLVVMDTESEAYWMFCNYMEYFKNDFMEEGMLRKIALVEQLLMKMDRVLYDYLQTMDMGLMFCHRWLLLNFKREFDYMEAVRLFEITSSRHLEVSSVEAELERSKERAKEFLKDSTGSHLEEIYLSPEYPFDIFVCVTMLMECRHMIMETEDLSAVYQILSNLPTTLDLKRILRKSEELFYRFCRKTVVDCFQVIDELEVQDFNSRKKFPFSFR